MSDVTLRFVAFVRFYIEILVSDQELFGFPQNLPVNLAPQIGCSTLGGSSHLESGLQPQLQMGFL